MSDNLFVLLLYACLCTFAIASVAIIVLANGGGIHLHIHRHEHKELTVTQQPMISPLQESGRVLINGAWYYPSQLQNAQLTESKDE